MKRKCFSHDFAMHHKSLYRPPRFLRGHPPGIYLLKISNGNTRTICDICSKTPERLDWLRSGVLLLTLSRFLTLFWNFYCWLTASKCQLGKAFFCIFTQWTNRCSEWTINILKQCHRTLFWCLRFLSFGRIFGETRKSLEKLK